MSENRGVSISISKNQESRFLTIAASPIKDVQVGDMEFIFKRIGEAFRSYFGNYGRITRASVDDLGFTLKALVDLNDSGNYHRLNRHMSESTSNKEEE